MLNMKKNKILSYEIKDIKLYGYHGLYEQEIKDGQNFYIDIYYKLNDSISIDDISEAVDYVSLVKKSTEIFYSKRCNLLEAVAKSIYIGIMETFVLFDLEVSIRKNQPLTIDNTKFIKVTYSDE